MIHPTLADGESFVEGRSTEKAKELLELAGEDRQGEVFTTSYGYIVPSAILPAGYDAVTNKDTAAVITQPGTATNAEAAAADADENPEGSEFDPSTATVDEVKEYLDGADDTERERVLAAEAEGKGRKGILDLAATPEGDK